MSKHQQKYGIRPLLEDSILQPCGYTPTCTKENGCQRAHNEAELEEWRRELVSTVREYKHCYHRLKTCITLEKNASNYCKHGLRCEFAHSQKELDVWIGSMPCRPSEGKLLEMCRNGADCRYQEECRYAHNDRELVSWTDEHHSNYLSSTASIPERCSYTMPTPTCQLGTSCPYAHSDDERENLISTLQNYDKTTPRPTPRVDKLLPYVLCENHKSDKKSFKGECIYGSQCKNAHTDQELEAWEVRRKAEEFKMFPVRPFDPVESLLQLCDKRRRGMGRVRCPRGVRCPYAHTKAELEDWTRKHEAHSLMLGPIDAQDVYSSDPFLITLIDYQRQFSDRLAIILREVVLKAGNDENLKDKLGAFIDYNRSKIDLSCDEGQKSASLYDLQYLLGYFQRNATVLADFVKVEKSFLIGVVTDLLDIRNLLAHGLYKDVSQEEEREKAAKFVQRGIAFVQCVVENVISSDSGEDSPGDTVIRTGYTGLVAVQETLRDFLSYQRENMRREESYSTMAPHDKKTAASEALRKLQELLEAENEPGTITKFIATSLHARFAVSKTSTGASL